MELRPRELSFWPTYGFVLGVFSLWMAGALLILRFSMGPIPSHLEGQFLEKLLQCVLGAVLLSAFAASLLLWKRRRERRWHWHINTTHIEFYRDGTLLGSVPWEEVSRVFYRKGRVVLMLRGLWIGIGLPGITKNDYKMLSSYRPAK